MNLTGHEFLKLGNVYTKSSLTKSKRIALRRFKTFFGASPTICSIVWRELKNDLPQGALPKHLLWCLSFLKQYHTEHCRRSIFHSDEKTIRKWTWVFVKLLSDMNVVIIFTSILISCNTVLKDNLHFRYFGTIVLTVLCMIRPVSFHWTVWTSKF